MAIFICWNLFPSLQVTGDSIYNLTRLGEVETDKDDRPLDPPPKITSVEVEYYDVLKTLTVDAFYISCTREIALKEIYSVLELGNSQVDNHIFTYQLELLSLS